MIQNKKINRVLYFVPFIFTLFFYLFISNNNFKLNGGCYEVLVDDFVLFTGIIFLLQGLFYLVFWKIIKNKKILIIADCLMIFVIRMWPIMLIIIIIGLFYKNNHLILNSVLDMFVVILGIFMSFLLFFNLNTIYKFISFHSRREPYKNEDFVINVDENKKHPNIYWIHMDGMPSIQFMKKYYNNDLEEFNQYLDDYYVNKDASFKGGHCTALALNSLFSPNYYDRFLKSYLEELDYCEIHKCKTKKTVAFNDLVEARIHSELVQSMREANYDVISVTEYNGYTFIPADYVYDIDNISKDHCIKYFKNDNNVEKTRKYINIKHKLALINRLYKLRYVIPDYEDKRLKIDIDIPEYEYLNNTDYLPFKASVKSIEDSKNKSNNSKFYFFDIGIVHVDWVYDKDGNKLAEHLEDLNYFNDNYVYSTKVLMDFLDYLRNNDPNGIIVVQGDHGIHSLKERFIKDYFNVDSDEVLSIRNSTINAVFVPEEYRNGEENNLSNPLNISRYLVNNFVGQNYSYIE